MSEAHLPESFSAWRLYGAGLENLHEDTLSLPQPGAREILVRVDAVGLCFSDMKIIRAGASHPKLWWQNLDEKPLTPGHEAVLTIVQCGSQIPAEFAPGNRYLIQCDIYIQGRSCAFGYGMNGAYSEYQIIDERIWQGETRSYLLPVPDTLSAAGTALIEPWSCVRGAYRLQYRRTPLAGGKLLIAAMPGDDRIYRAGKLFAENRPALADAFNLSGEAVAALSAELGIPVRPLEKLPETADYDDVIAANITDKSLMEAVIGLTGWRGMAGFFGDVPAANCGIDVGALHYCHRFYQGAGNGDFSALYETPARSALKAGGTVWFPGGAGAMGQMHVELALAGNAARVLVSDLDDKRLAHLVERLLPLAKKLGKVLEAVNPKRMSGAEFETLLHSFAPQGFDDVVILVPVPAMAEQVARHLADNAVVNFFAGIPAGTPALLPLGDILKRNVRWIGSSGSSFEDMADTLAMAIRGEFRPQNAMAAIGGMNALKQGLEAVANGRFPGKTAILPGCPDLPLTELKDLAKLDEKLAATLDESGAYTKATEDYLISKWGRK